MRDLKFRAWDKENNCFFKPTYEAYKGRLEDLSIDLSGELTMHTYDTPFIHESVFPNRFVIQQYTGLKDKNGKEIYEGDIVRTWEQEEYVPDRDSGGGIVGYDKVDGFSQLGVVSYEGASFIYTTQKHLEGREEKLSAPIDWFNELVVVGNVHDNPELIQ